MPKLLSARALFQSAAETLKRFPFVIADAAIGTAAVLMLVEKEFNNGSHWQDNVLFAAILGLPLFVAAATAAERAAWKRTTALAVNAAAAAVVILYGCSLPIQQAGLTQHHYIRLLFLVFGMHALAAFAPFTGRNELNGFWQFNKVLFLRYLTAALYSGVLYAGLAIALAAVQHLFVIEIPGKRYGQLWFLIAGMFNTWFFLAGIPRDIANLQLERSYPKALKIFTQYVLLPLVAIYLVILYAYEIKILIEWDWPKGWVSNLVLGFSVAGILSFLLLWPVQEDGENKWIRTFSRGYYLALVPLVVMLLLAIWVRTRGYGFTELRYIVAVLGVWLTGIVLYFIFSKTKSIKIIPVTLCIIALAASYGPWSAFSVSRSSQMKRLVTILESRAMLTPEGIIRKPQQDIPPEDEKEINSIVSYIIQMHGITPLREMFAPAGQAKIDTIAKHSGLVIPDSLLAMMGVNKVDRWDSPGKEEWEYYAEPSSIVDVRGFEYLFQEGQFPRTSTAPAETGERYHVRFDSLKAELHIVRAESDSVTVSAMPMLSTLSAKYRGTRRVFNIPAQLMTIDTTSAAMKVRVMVKRIDVRKGINPSVKQFVFHMLIGRP